MFDRDKEFSDLLANVDVRLKTAQARIQAAKPLTQKTAEKLQESVEELDKEARVVTASLREILSARAERRAEKISAARYITKAALRLFASGAVSSNN